MKNLFHILIVQCGNYIFPIITIPIVSRALGPSLIGVYSLLTAITAYFTLVVTYSFNYTGIRRLSDNSESRSDIFNVVFFSKITLFFISLVFFYFLSNAYQLLETNKVASWICFLSVFSCVFQNNWIFQFCGDFKIISNISIFTKLLSCVLIFLLVKVPSDFIYYILIVQLTLLIGNVYSFFYSLVKYRIKLTYPRISSIKSFLLDDSFIFLSGVLANLYTTSSIVLLGSLTNSESVGYYSSAQKVIDLIKNFSVLPLNMLIFPYISRKLSQSREEGLELFSRFMPFFIAIATLSSLFIFLFGGVLISIFFGNGFLDSIALVKILAIGYFSVFFGVIIGGQVVLGLGLDRQFVAMQSLVALFSLSFNYILLPSGGALTTAWVWSISESGMFLMQLLILYKHNVKIFNFSYFTFSQMKVTLSEFFRW